MHIATLAALSIVCSGPQPAAGPPPLRVLTYNILAGDRGLQGLTDTISSTSPDLVALQEVDVGTRRSGRIDEAAKLATALKLNHAFVPHFDYQGGQFGLALLSRFPILRAERVRVKGSRLSLLDATVRTPKADVRLLVVHFTPTIPFRDGKEQSLADAARLAEATAASQLAAKATGPLLVLGDMNDDTGSVPYELFAKTLQDSCDVKGSGIAKTWNSAFPITRIDYIWASRAFTVVSCDTVSSRASDHLPVLAELQLR